MFYRYHNFFKCSIFCINHNYTLNNSSFLHSEKSLIYNRYKNTFFFHFQCTKSVTDCFCKFLIDDFLDNDLFNRKMCKNQNCILHKSLFFHFTKFSSRICYKRIFRFVHNYSNAYETIN